MILFGICDVAKACGDIAGAAPAAVCAEPGPEAVQQAAAAGSAGEVHKRGSHVAPPDSWSAPTTPPCSDQVFAHNAQVLLNTGCCTFRRFVMGHLVSVCPPLDLNPPRCFPCSLWCCYCCIATAHCCEASAL